MPDTLQQTSLPMVLGGLKFICWLTYGLLSTDLRLTLISCLGATVFGTATACHYAYSVNRVKIRLQLVGAIFFYSLLVTALACHADLALILSR